MESNKAVFNAAKEIAGCDWSLTIEELEETITRHLRKVEAGVEQLAQPIRCSDRLPTAQDATDSVLWLYDPNYGWRLDHWFKTTGITHWLPTGLAVPDAPKDI